jgi:hypothetical protein
MSGADEVLELIDTTLTDWAVSADAMRSVPAGDEPAARALTPEQVADAYDVPCHLVAHVTGTRSTVHGQAVHYDGGPADPLETLRRLRDASNQDWADAVIRLTVQYYRSQVNEAREALRPAFEAAQEAARTAYRQFRGNHWVLCPCPPQEPDPKAWVAFTDQPAKRPRAHHRRGPDPRRVSVRRAPARTGRRA